MLYFCVSDFPTSVDEIRERVKDAQAIGRALQPIGGATQLHIGYPPTSPTAPLPLVGLDKLLDYAPDDMVVIAQAGVTLAALQEELALNAQWLPVECALPERQTLGGIVSTRSSSTLRAGYGSVRDWLIGIEVVGAAGRIIRGGGRVVKNVSGYDLPKLYCGAWGTLGVVTEVAFKVAPIPEASSTILALLSAERNSEEALDSLLSDANPVLTTLVNPAAAKILMGADAEPAQYLVVRIDGPTEAVALQADHVMASLARYSTAAINLPPNVSGPLLAGIRDFQLGDSTLCAEFHILSSQVGAFARMIEWTARRAGFNAAVVADCRSGVLHAQIDAADADDVPWTKLLPDLIDKAQRVGGSFVLKRMPASWREAGVAVWQPMLVDERLTSGIKRALDPAGIFNPGRFVGGI